MCGRFAQTEALNVLIEKLHIDDILAEENQCYNFAPGQKVLSVICQDGKRKAVDFKWGLIPHWAKDKSIGNKLINARSETAHEKPSFKYSFKSKRCLIPVTGFYEWQKSGKEKRPVFIYLKSNEFFTLGGLYSNWTSPGGDLIQTCTILTTEPNSLLEPVHNRMPVIIKEDNHKLWLDTAVENNQEELLSILNPYPPDEMAMHYVSKYVNTPGNNGPQCTEPLAD